MVDPNTESVVELGNRVDRLVELYRNARRDNEMLSNEVAQLTSQLKEAVNSKAEVEEHLGHAKMAKVLENAPGDIQQTRSRINQIVREIDKCIALLNR
jgi:predicted  nucleic acid-binding Zn-ribbon protein